MSNTSHPLSKLAIEQMKREAKRIAKAKNISHASALDAIAKPLGYTNWSMLMQDVRKTGMSPNVSTSTHSVEPAPILVVPVEMPPGIIATPVIAELPASLTETNKPKKAKTVKEPKPPKPPKPVKEKKPVWRSSTTIGKEYALSGHMVRKVLLANSYIDVHGNATQKALDAEVVQIKMIESKYSASTALVPFLLWSEKIVEELFDAPSELDTFCHITSRYQAEARMCEAFARAGAVLGVSFSGYDLEEAKSLGLTQDEYSAVIEAHHNDPHFMGGPGVFANSRTPKEIAALNKSVLPLIVSIYDKLVVKNLVESAFFGTATTTIYEWILNQSMR